MEFKAPEKTPHRIVKDEDTVTKLANMRKAMQDDFNGMLNAAMHAIVGVGPGIATLSAAGLDVRFMAYEICPDTLRVFRQHSEDYHAAVLDLCKLLGVE